jgi:hypothetical protein
VFNFEQRHGAIGEGIPVPDASQRRAYGQPVAIFWTNSTCSGTLAPLSADPIAARVLTSPEISTFIPTSRRPNDTDGILGIDGFRQRHCSTNWLMHC